jgi:hypothetical protein
MSRVLDHLQDFHFVATGAFEAASTGPDHHTTDGPTAAVKLEDLLVSSVVTDRSHAGLLDSLSAPPAGWDLRQSSTD